MGATCALCGIGLAYNARAFTPFLNLLLDKRSVTLTRVGNERFCVLIDKFRYYAWRSAFKYQYSAVKTFAFSRPYTTEAKANVPNNQLCNTNVG